MSQELILRPLHDGEYGRWNRLVSEAAEGSPYADTRYLATLATATGGTWDILGVLRGEELLGGQPRYIESQPWGNVLSSRLLLYYNGPVVRRSVCASTRRVESRRHQVLSLLEKGARQGCSLVRLKMRAPESDYRPLLWQGWQGKPIFTYVVDLSDLDRIWSRIDHNLRRLIRRCERNHHSFLTPPDATAFCAMHLEVHRRKDAPLYLPTDRFESFVAELRRTGLGELFQVNLPDGTPAASQLVIFSGHPVTHTIAAAASAEAQKSGANAFLRWRVFQWLSERGYRANDLTDAHERSVARFKSQLGAEIETTLQWEAPRSRTSHLVEQAHSFAARATAKVLRLTGGSSR